jgi:acyl-CoA thioesterase I
MKWGVSLLVLVLAAGVFYFLRAPAITNYPSSGTDIIAFGDSLIAGSGASEGNDLVSILSKQIGQPIINLGVRGDTTADGLKRISDIDSYNPKVVILLLGGNDYLRRIPQEETFENLGKIIEHIHAEGAVVLLLGVRGGVLRDNFASQYKELSKTYGTAYVSDVLDGLLGHSEYMSDRVHPNDEGYQRIADRVAPFLKKLLR